MGIPTAQPTGQPAQKTNGLALTAGILSIAGIVVTVIGFVSTFIPLLGPFGLACGCGLGLLMAILGLILGFIALAQLKSHPEQKGKGLAVLGIVIGILSILSICVGGILIAVGGTAALTILGPQIGNIFSQINSSLATPAP